MEVNQTRIFFHSCSLNISGNLWAIFRCWKGGLISMHVHQKKVLSIWFFMTLKTYYHYLVSITSWIQIYLCHSELFFHSKSKIFCLIFLAFILLNTFIFVLFPLEIIFFPIPSNNLLKNFVKSKSALKILHQRMNSRIIPLCFVKLNRKNLTTTKGV